jgi:hypothetical protein
LATVRGSGGLGAEFQCRHRVRVAVAERLASADLLRTVWIVVLVVNGPPTLYTLLEQPQNQRMTIRLTPDPGVQAYSFTFD